MRSCAELAQAGLLTVGTDAEGADDGQAVLDALLDAADGDTQAARLAAL